MKVELDCVEVIYLLNKVTELEERIKALELIVEHLREHYINGVYREGSIVKEGVVVR